MHAAAIHDAAGWAGLRRPACVDELGRAQLKLGVFIARKALSVCAEGLADQARLCRVSVTWVR
jgi:hypothetical protein